MKQLFKKIVVEDRFREVIDYLPGMSISDGELHKPIFHFGGVKELTAFLKNNKTPYPLIWMIYPFKETDLNKKIKCESIEFIIAVNTNSSMFNDERIETTYKQILIPLFENFINAIILSSTIYIDSDISSWKHPNYSDENATDDEHFSTDIWDAIKVSFDCTINNLCLKPIKL